MDLSKAFDCISHDLLIVKLHAYGLDEYALVLMYSYLKNRNSLSESIIRILPSKLFYQVCLMVLLWAPFYSSTLMIYFYSPKSNFI